MTQHLTGKESGYHCERSDTLYAGRALCRERRQKLVFFKAHPWLLSEEELQWRRSWSQEVGEEAWPKEPAEERARAGQLGQGREDLEGSGVGVRSREEQWGAVTWGWGPLLLWETGRHSTGKGRRKEALATDYWVLGIRHVLTIHKAGIVINITLILEMKKWRHREVNQLAQGQTVMW